MHILCRQQELSSLDPDPVQKRLWPPCNCVLGCLKALSETNGEVQLCLNMGASPGLKFCKIRKRKWFVVTSSSFFLQRYKCNAWLSWWERTSANLHSCFILGLISLHQRQSWRPIHGIILVNEWTEWLSFWTKIWGSTLKIPIYLSVTWVCDILLRLWCQFLSSHCQSTGETIAGHNTAVCHCAISPWL